MTPEEIVTVDPPEVTGTVDPPSVEANPDEFNVGDHGIPGGGLDGNASPKTGDDSNTPLHLILFMASFIAALCSGSYLMKNMKHERRYSNE